MLRIAGHTNWEHVESDLPGDIRDIISAARTRRVGGKFPHRISLNDIALEECGLDPDRWAEYQARVMGVLYGETARPVREPKSRAA